MIDRHLFQLAGANSIAKRLAVLEVLQAFFIIGQAVALSIVLTQLWQGKNLNIEMLLVFIVCFSFRQIINWLNEKILDHYSSRVSEELRKKLLQKVFVEGQALIQKQGTGSLITMALDGIDEVRQYIKLVFSKVLTMMIVPIFIFIAMLFLNWPSALILLAMYPLIVLFMIILGHAAQDKAISKSIYYLTDLHSSQPAKGLRRYDRLAQSYQITFCSYTVFPDTPDYVNSFSLRHDTTGELLTDAISLTFVELSKLGEVVKKPVSNMTDLDKWSVFFQYAPDLEHREIVNKVIESKEVLQVAGNLLMSISQNERERAIFRSRRKFQTDMQSDLATAEDNGRVAGRAERSIEIARNALQMKMTVADIVQLTGLTLEEIENLRKEI